MDKKYHSKIGWIIIITIILILPLVSYSIFQEDNGWIAVLVLIFPLLILILYLLWNTYYIIRNTHFIVKCGFFFYKEIAISEIEKISASRNPISAPAFSLDRLELKYGKGQMILIPPKQKAIFIQNLLSINPKIKVASS